ncbi:hypothetical protein [Streptomyces sp. Rer75]|uniref:hypothetical protein n=1 Tax=unclassified Streptomyces TaxID=2593676 RepID=UPI0015CF87C6|nr:hypothetical protein [Streptomyces sp. Rer75]QLH25188.1 hypothetical protein HYQ63_34885 [Streptomyces sp. Rer75]
MLTDTICAALSAAGLGIAGLTAYRKRFRTAARIAAYALLPVGLAMTGILDWLTDLVFNPTVWAGFGLLGLSWLLFMVSRAAERRAGGTRKERRAAAAAERDGALAPGASEPALGPGRGATGAKAAGKGKPTTASSSGTEDFSDIEAILKKHGI